MHTTYKIIGRFVACTGSDVYLLLQSMKLKTYWDAITWSKFLTAETSWLVLPQSGYPGCRQTGYESFTLVLNSNGIRQPQGAAFQFILQPQYTDFFITFLIPSSGYMKFL